MNRILAIDWGGTFLKSALFFPDGSRKSLPEIPTHSDGTKEEILAALRAVMRQAERFDAVGISIPGPFDYKNGISRMEHKFLAIKGLPLREQFSGIPMRFVHDANAFLLGENACGAAKGCRKSAGITLGTGLGAAFLDNGQLRCNEMGDPADSVSLWSKPFRGGIVEDFISARGLMKLCPCKNGLELFTRAKAGDPAALKAWRIFGENLAEVLTPWAERLQPEKIVIGGQIAKSMVLFQEPLAGLPVVQSVLSNDAALVGAARLWTRGTKVQTCLLKSPERPEFSIFGGYRRG